MADGRREAVAAWGPVSVVTVGTTATSATAAPKALPISAAMGTDGS